MNQQSTSEPKLQRIFWRAGQVTLTFHTTIPLISSDGTNNTSSILRKLQLDLDSRHIVLTKLNQFLKDSGYALNFFTEENSPQAPVQPVSTDREQGGDAFMPPPGVYVFGLERPLATLFGTIETGVVTFFTFKPDSGGASAEANLSADKGQSSDPVVEVVNALNRGLQTLNQQGVQVSAASPVWLLGGTSPVPQGCPLTPPMPITDEEDSSCSYWHYRLPHLAPKELRKMNGEGVTVLILDTLPERKQIRHAVKKAGDDNLLLQDVSESITYNYHFLSPGIEVEGSDHIAVGKDVYGHHYVIKDADHGLFIAGIVHDIAPKATIECIRVLDDYCVGDSNMFVSALYAIEKRMLKGGDLYQKPVVINMSLVIPSKVESAASGLVVDVSPTDDVLTQIRVPLRSLVERGAIITASAGNDFDLRDNATGKRQPALYPAAFAYAPDSMGEIIPVGAVNKHGKASSYSNYPGPLGIATYGGEVPKVEPPQPDPHNPPVVKITDAVRGIYSSEAYPALVAPQPDYPVPTYPAPNDHAWAYWIGTSFATPVITGVVARILELRLKGTVIPHVRNAVLAAAAADTTNWDALDPITTGVGSGSAVGSMIRARQTCIDEDEEDEVDIEVISVVTEE